MKTRPPTFEDLEQTAAELLQADLTVTKLRARLYAMIRALYDAGYRPVDIAAAAGVTRQRVNQLLVAGREKERHGSGT